MKNTEGDGGGMMMVVMMVLRAVMIDDAGKNHVDGHKYAVGQEK